MWLFGCVLVMWCLLLVKVMRLGNVVVGGFVCLMIGWSWLLC